MALFSADKLRRVREIVRRYHEGFGVALFGPQAAQEVAAELRRRGLIPEDTPDLLEDAGAYARLLARLEEPDLMGASPDEILRRLEVEPSPPLTPSERVGVNMAARHAGQYVTNLGDRVTSRIMGAITGLEGGLTPDQIREVVADTTAANRERREGVGRLKRDLGEQVGSWERDWQRVAQTETNNAVQEQTAAHLEKTHGDPLVSKLPRSDACRDCMRLYTDGGTPKIFRLSKMRANGSNVGRKRSAWLPVVEAMHPWCACFLVRVPEGMRWEGMELIVDETAKSYKLHYRTTFQGIPISIENRKGSVRRWTDDQGNRGETELKYPYGYIRGTTGADDDEIDVYIGPRREARGVYIVHQNKKKADGQWGGHDEDKVFLGFESSVSAKKAYHEHMSDPQAFGSITSMPVEHFKKVLGKNKGKKLRLIQAIPANEDRVLRKARDSEPAGTVKMAHDGTMVRKMDRGWWRPLIQDSADLTKSRGFPIDTVRQWKDGKTYRKGPDGWERTEPRKEAPEFMLANHAIEYKTAPREGLHIGVDADKIGFEGTEHYGHYLRVRLPKGDENNIQGIQLKGSREGTFAVIHRATKPGSKTWQVSWFDQDGAIGDTQRDSLQELLDVTRGDGYAIDEVKRKSDLAKSWTADDLIKAAQHKYIRRFVTGLAKPKYRYVYNVSSKHNVRSFKMGDKLEIEHDGVRGHYEVTAQSEDGKWLSVRHDETGHITRVSQVELYELWHRQNRGKLSRKYKNINDVARHAAFSGTPAQRKVAQKRVDDFTARFGEWARRAPTLTPNGIDTYNDTLGARLETLLSSLGSDRVADKEANNVVEIKMIDDAKKLFADWENHATASMAWVDDNIASHLLEDFGLYRPEGKHKDPWDEVWHRANAAFQSVHQYMAEERWRDLKGAAKGARTKRFKRLSNDLMGIWLLGHETALAGDRALIATRKNRDRDTDAVVGTADAAGIPVLIHEHKSRGLGDKQVRENVRYIADTVRSIKRAGFGAALDGLRIHLRFGPRKGNPKSVNSGKTAGFYLPQSIYARNGPQEQQHEIMLSSQSARHHSSSRYELLTHEVGHRFYYKSLPEWARHEWESHIIGQTTAAGPWEGERFGQILDASLVTDGATEAHWEGTSEATPAKLDNLPPHSVVVDQAGIEWAKNGDGSWRKHGLARGPAREGRGTEVIKQWRATPATRASSDLAGPLLSVAKRGTDRLDWHAVHRRIDGDFADSPFIGPALHALADRVQIETRGGLAAAKTIAKRLEGVKILREHITDYGATDPSEAFAEAFAIHLKAGRRALGPWTREFFERLARHGGVSLRRSSLGSVSDLRKSGGPFIGPRGGKWRDAQHKIPWREGAPRTGAIEVPNETLHATIGRLTARWKLTRHGLFADGSVTGGVPRAGVKMRTADGKQIDVEVVAVPVMASQGPDRRASGSYTKSRRNKAVAHSVLIRFEASPGIDAEHVRADMRRVLGHELAHAADPSSGNRVSNYKTSEAYVNAKHEVTARIQEITRHVRTHATSIKEDFDDDWLQTPVSIAHLSPTWRNIEEHLTTENRKRVLKAVASTVTAIREGKLGAIGKSDRGSNELRKASGWLETRRQRAARHKLHLLKIPNAPEEFLTQVDRGRPLTGAQLKKLWGLLHTGLSGSELAKGGRFPVGTTRTWKDGNTYRKVKADEWRLIRRGHQARLPFTDAERKSLKAEIAAAAKEEKIDLDAYFASGSNQEGEIQGFHAVGMHLGVAANHLDNAGRSERALIALKGTGRKVFVDSGAFGEISFNIPVDKDQPELGLKKGDLPFPDEPIGKPYVTEPIDHAEWVKRLDLYDRLARELGPQMFAVAPDKVAFQGDTLKRLKRYILHIKRIRAHGANVMVPLQKANDALPDQGNLTLAEMDQRVSELFGDDDYIRAIPMKKDATTVADLTGLLKSRGGHIKRIHLLGLGESSKSMPEVLAAVAKVAPDVKVTADSVRITALVGRSKKTGKPRKLQAAIDRARLHTLDRALGSEIARYQAVSKPSEWASRAALINIARSLDLKGKDRKDMLADPDAWAQEPADVPWAWDDDDEAWVPVRDATRIDDPTIQHMFEREYLRWHIEGAKPGSRSGDVRARKFGGVVEAFSGITPGVHRSRADWLSGVKGAGSMADALRYDNEVQHRVELFHAIQNKEVQPDEYAKIHAASYGPLATFMADPMHNLDNLGKSIPMVSRATLDLIEFGSARPATHPQIVQGADNVPTKSRPAHTTGMDDYVGVTRASKKERSKERKRKCKAREERIRRDRAALDVFKIVARPTGQDGDVATARGYVPDAMKESREGTRTNMDRKRASILAEAKRRRGWRISEAILSQERKRGKYAGDSSA